MPRPISVVAAGLFLGTLALSSAARPPEDAPAESNDPDYAAMAREAIRSHQPDPEADNAWPQFVRLCHVAEGAVMVFTAEPEVQAWIAEQGPEASESGMDLLRDVLEAPDRLGDAEREAVAAFLERLERTMLFDEVDHLAQEECIVPPVISPLLTRVYAHLGAVRALATICAARMIDAHRAGDEDEVVRSFEHLLAIERAACCEVGLVPRLVSFAVRGLAVESVARMVRKQDLSPTLAARLGEAMGGHEPLPMAMTIETERLSALDTVANTYGSIDGAVGAAGGRRGAGLPVPGLTDGSEDEAREMINTYMDGLRDWLVGEAAKRDEGWAKMERVFAICEEDHTVPHVTLVGMLLPGRTKIDASARRIDAMTVGVRTMLAIEQFEAERGGPPNALDQLVPECLAALPPDPYASDGVPLRYRVLEKEADEDGRSYLLYTVGADGEDNGGKISPDGMINGLSPIPAGRGYDFVFTSPQWE